MKRTEHLAKKCLDLAKNISLPLLEQTAKEVEGNDIFFDTTDGVTIPVMPWMCRFEFKLWNESDEGRIPQSVVLQFHSAVDDWCAAFAEETELEAI
jgi:hypothetical protein